MKINSLSQTAPNLDFDIPEQAKLPIDPFAKIQKELYQKYDRYVVDQVINQARRYKISELPETEALRLRLYCHYYDLEKRAESLFDNQPAVYERLFKRYVRHSRNEINNYIGNKDTSKMPTLKKLDKIYDNFVLFRKALPAILDSYGEWVCHRSLNHFSILSSQVLTGQERFPDTDHLLKSIDHIFGQEKKIQQLIEQSPSAELDKRYEEIQEQISQLQDPSSTEDLYNELALKTGKVYDFRPIVEEEAVRSFSELFKASLDGRRWAENQESLEPIDKTIQKNLNDVFFLKSSSPSEPEKNVAVFKAQKSGHSSAAMEAFAFDVALIFGLSEGLVPTKRARINGKAGSIQIFQEGLCWDQFKALPEEEQSEIISKISLKDFLKAALGSVLIGNRDVHMNNFFFVKNDDDESYKIIVFDNELSFMYSNSVLTYHAKDVDNLRSKSEKKEIKNKEENQANEKKDGSPQESVFVLPKMKYESFLPLRAALLVFPQADEIIRGETKEWLRQLIQTWPEKYEDFFVFYNSLEGIHRLRDLPNQGLNHSQLKAFKERVEKLIRNIDSDKEYSFRDLLKKVYPLFSDFFNLTRMLYKVDHEFGVGVRSAEYLCQKALKKKLINKETAEKFLKKVYKLSKN